MEMYFDPKLTDLFRDTSRDEWNFTNDASGGDIRLMRFHNDAYSSVKNLPGFDQLDEFMQKKLSKDQVYSLSEVEGWTRIEFQDQRLIDMFGSDVVYVPPEKDDALFYKSLEQWFEGLPYRPDSQIGSSQEEDFGGDQFNLTDTKSYGLTSSLMSIFGDE
jgi:hypothetical protein